MKVIVHYCSPELRLVFATWLMFPPRSPTLHPYGLIDLVFQRRMCLCTHHSSTSVWGCSYLVLHEFSILPQKMCPRFSTARLSTSWQTEKPPPGGWLVFLKGTLSFVYPFWIVLKEDQKETTPFGGVPYQPSHVWAWNLCWHVVWDLANINTC